MDFLTGYESGAARTKHSDASGLRCVGDSLTVQADARESDINFIMDRFAKTGQFPGYSRVPEYGDFDQVSDFRTALDQIRQAEHDFMQLPAKLRAEFDNNPVKFVDFVDNASLEDLDGLGLLTKEAHDALQEKRQAVKTEGSGAAAEGGAAAAAGNARDSGRNRAKSDKDAE